MVNIRWLNLDIRIAWLDRKRADVKIILSHIGYKIITLNRGTVTRGTIQTDNAWKNIADALEKMQF